MNKKQEKQVEHFAILKSKYQATRYEDLSPSSPLYLILRKADLGIEITDIERNWLTENKLLETLKNIQQEQQFKTKEMVELQLEFSNLKSKYKATTYHISWKSTSLYFILSRLESGNQLTESEMHILRSYNLTETIAIAKEMECFATLKVKYQANKHQDSSPDSTLYKILKQLEREERLSGKDINWLKKNELLETLVFFQQQEAAREAEFAQLKDKYQASKHSDSSVSSSLYPILQKLEANQSLNESETDWLKQAQLTETLDIVLEMEQKRHFTALKVKYKATEYEDSSLSSHLYKVLKILEGENHLSEQDINFLKKRNLTETIAIALDKYTDSLKDKIESGKQLEESEITWLKDNGRENIIAIAQAKHFATLKSKYDVSDYQNKSIASPLYAILEKLENGERLEATEVAWLEENKTKPRPSNYSYYGWQEERDYGWQEEGHKLFSGKIKIAYHKIEATFYEAEYQRTGNKWNLPNASSHWRKAEQPKQALKLTDNLNFDKIKENKLKSALLTTRGGAFRDIDKLDEAEECARKAIEYQPSSHHPYTLMGAICFERGEYSQGENWFAEAIKRGASPRDQDAEMKRVVKNAKDEKKRREVVDYLLKKDPQRYAWAKSYLKKQKNKDK